MSQVSNHSIAGGYSSKRFCKLDKNYHPYCVLRISNSEFFTTDLTEPCLCSCLFWYLRQQEDFSGTRITVCFWGHRIPKRCMQIIIRWLFDSSYRKGSKIFWKHEMNSQTKYFPSVYLLRQERQYYKYNFFMFNKIPYFTSCLWKVLNFHSTHTRKDDTYQETAAHSRKPTFQFDNVICV